MPTKKFGTTKQDNFKLRTTNYFSTENLSVIRKVEKFLPRQTTDFFTKESNLRDEEIINYANLLELMAVMWKACVRRAYH